MKNKANGQLIYAKVWIFEDVKEYVIVARFKLGGR